MYTATTNLKCEYDTSDIDCRCSILGDPNFKPHTLKVQNSSTSD